MNRVELSSGDDDRSGTIRDFIKSRPWIDQVARIGWLSRGIVYVVVGVTAILVAFQSAGSGDEASPSGALAQIAGLTGGRLLLAVLVTGMILYVGFQLLSLVLIRGTSIFSWWRRAGHVVASILYTMFAWSAAGLVFSGSEDAGQSLIERLSRAVLLNAVGQWMVGIAGLATIGGGCYFLYRHAVQRGFADGLVDVEPTDTGSARATLVLAGVIGWVGRSLVIVLIGFFLVLAALTFDPSDARGFDRALRQTSGSLAGSALVFTVGIGLAAYGAFCIASHRVRTIRDNESDE